MTKTRPIKFRAFLKGNQKMYDVLTLDIIDQKALIENTEDEKRPLRGYVKMSEIELMQYTGLLDINGVEIFEGDVILNAYYEENGKVVFEEGCFVVKYKTWQHELFEGYADCVIVGNIYENPDLLKECENE